MVSWSVFEALVAEVQPRLARAFVAAYGVERGQEALAEAMAYAWNTLSQRSGHAGYGGPISGPPNPARGGWLPPAPAPADLGVPWVEPGLPAALAGLSEHQRVAVVLVHGYGWTHREVGELLGVAPRLSRTTSSEASPASAAAWR